jgi:UDP-sugar diphosphatase
LESALFLAFIIVFNLLAGSLPTAGAQSEELYLTILHTNDEHSALVPSPFIDYDPDQQNPALGGFARLATFVKNIKSHKAQTGEPVLLLSGGDYLGGSPFAWLALDGKAPELSLMQALGYDAVTIGNHEYDFGPEQLAVYLKAAGYPMANAKTAIVAANTHPPAGHPLNLEELGIKSTYIKVLENGLKVGFFGLIGKDAVNVAPLSAPIEFSDQVEAAQKAVQELQKAGVDLIIAISHAGVEEDKGLARAVPGINVIVGGHCHTLLEEPVIEGETIIVQSGELLKHVGMLELAYNPTTGKVRILNAEKGNPFIQALDSTIPSDPEMSTMVSVYTEHLNSLISDMTGGRFTDIREAVVWTDFVVTNQPPLEETPFGNFVTDAMRIIAQEATGERVHIAFQANGVIRGSIEPGSMPWSKGQVSFFDLGDLVGLGSGPDGTPGYPMVSVYFTGEELRRIFEVQVLLAELMGNTYFLQISGAKLEYDPTRAVLFTVPFVDIPVPSTRAVMAAMMYTGDGVQDEGNKGYVPIRKGDETLYHVVTDYYIAAFLPMVGDMLPSLELILKDKHGNPIVDLDDAIIYRDGKELKVWQAVMEFAASQPLDAQGNPRLPDYYRTTAGRLVHVKSIPLLLWPTLGLILIVGLTVWAVRRRRNRRKKRLAA